MAGDAARPRCTQVEIQGARVVRDEEGGPVVVEIEESSTRGLAHLNTGQCRDDKDPGIYICIK